MEQIKVNIIKLGGSILSDKRSPFFLEKKNIKILIEQVKNYYWGKSKNKENPNRVILIHGGGSFGHPIARKYEIYGDNLEQEKDKGKDKEKDKEAKNEKFPQENKETNNYENTYSKERVFGIVKTHNVMEWLNSELIEPLNNYKIPAIPIQPSTTFIKEEKTLRFSSMDILHQLLVKNIIPVFYGDILFHTTNRVSILSGDTIIQKLIQDIEKNEKDIKIQKLIFCIDKQGILNEDGNLIESFSIQDLEKVEIAKRHENIDVTGGLKNKLRQIKKIRKFNIPISLLDGTKDQNLLKCLRGNEFTGTKIQ